MKFPSLPVELLLSVADLLPIEDLSSLVLTCPKLTFILTPHFENQLAQFPDGLTPLQWAAEHGHASLAELAILKGAEIDELGYMSRTPLHWAAHYNHPAVIRILLKHGASIDRRDEKYKTPLHLAASQGAVEGTRALLEPGAGIGDGTIPPARSAAGSGNVDCMKAFIDAGFNPNTRDLSNRTSLHHVLCGLGKNPEVLEYLPTQESAKMAVNAQDRTGKTPLHLAAERIGAEQHIRLLLDHGADRVHACTYSRV